jgi:phosphoribosylformylglycinamidine (FGAM) synthase PurS component
MSSAEIHAVQLEHQRDVLLMQYQHKLRIMAMKRAGARLVYANQADAAQAIVAQFLAGKRWVVLVAPPGAGKTGVILEVLRILGQHPNAAIQCHIDDMLVLTGMSDTDWTNTMKDGMLPALAKCVYHRQQLQSVDLGSMQNGIIVTDECHVACKQGQTIDKMLSGAGLKNIDTLKRRNMRMLDVSATPESVLHDLLKWRTDTAVVMLAPDEKYKGFQTMKDEGRLHSAKDFDLEKYEDVMKLLTIFRDRYERCSSKKYFAFRLQSETARQNVREACAALGWDKPEAHDSANRVEDIDEVMTKAPTKHKVFFVKGLWRASKRLVRMHVGGTVESNTQRPDDTAKSQGLTARFCSTFDWEGEQEDVTLRPLHFDDVESLDRYINWHNNGCDYNEAAYSAPRMKSDGNGHVRAPKSKADPAGIVGVEIIDEDPAPLAAPITPPRQRAAPAAPRAKTQKLPRAHKPFTTLDAARAFYVRKFGTQDGWASAPRKCKTTGKFVCSFANMESAVYTVDVVAAHLASGNLWGANGAAFSKAGNELGQIGTVKIGYTGDVPTFFLCVQGRKGANLSL